MFTVQTLGSLLPFMTADG